jgi:Holliday junction resolvase
VPIPPDPILRAALRWIEQLPASDVPRTRSLFTSHSAFSDITPTQYDAALIWLRERNLVDRLLSGQSGKRAVLEAAIKQTLWFTDADSLIIGPSDLPEDALRAAEAIGVPRAETYAVVRHAWGKVDAAARSRVGSAGERELLRLLSAVPEIEVRHVAAESDGYGYDIDAGSDGWRIHLEVKATTRRGRLKVYLSRHEFETMRSDQEWTLVAVRLDHDLQAAAVANISREWLTSAAPVDREVGARWESMRLDVPADAITDGIPGLVAHLGLQAMPPVLAGMPRWPGNARPTSAQ